MNITDTSHQHETLGHRTIVYIDGFNLYYGALKRTPYKWLDPVTFAESLLPRNQVTRVRYFTARIKPRPDDPQAPSRQQAYLRALSANVRLTIHEGQFFTSHVRMTQADPDARPRTVKVIKSEEKGSDVNLATYLMRDAYLNEAEAFVVISNDSDLTEPMRLVKHEAGKIVGLISPYPTNSRALMTCGPDFAKTVRTHHLENSQMPVAVSLPDGSTVRKPEHW
ncbi:hypothetical protein C5D07_03435 [Rathayibacter tritici]|uniref:NYN domain-containing protein n=1 Tax=Rathayibacter tritici TaxID=33888 RepID=UPI000CE7F3A4|nr:NYN domain-containing protein [Rathayibacter tritici]PPF29515.1 hypothetical protein C5C06_06310 [Rathayibacter tritici]PPI18311.1 hypothetical protein C5D07_03435 [Rathayibacter tritici]